MVLNVVLSGTQQYSEVLSMLLIGSWYDTQCEIQVKSVLVLTGTQCCTQCGAQFGTQLRSFLSPVNGFSVAK